MGRYQRRLYEECRVEVPIIEWGGRKLVRVSVQGYNRAEDIEALLDALEALRPRPWCAEGARPLEPTRDGHQRVKPDYNVTEAWFDKALTP